MPRGRHGDRDVHRDPASSQPPGLCILTAIASYSRLAARASRSWPAARGRTRPTARWPRHSSNAGVSADSDTGAADLDGSGYSFSATALASAGVTPGSAVTAGGLSFAWPAAAPGSADNVVASGQEIAVNQSGSTLGFLDTSTYGPVQGSGHDRLRQRHDPELHAHHAGLVLGRGTANSAISMAYRNAPGNVQNSHPVNVYEQSVALDSTAQVAGVILPDIGQGVSGPALHIFAIAVG